MIETFEHESNDLENNDSTKKDLENLERDVLLGNFEKRIKGFIKADNQELNDIDVDKLYKNFTGSINQLCQQKEKNFNVFVDTVRPFLKGHTYQEMRTTTMQYLSITNSWNNLSNIIRDSVYNIGKNIGVGKFDDFVPFFQYAKDPSGIILNIKTNDPKFKQKLENFKSEFPIYAKNLLENKTKGLDMNEKFIANLNKLVDKDEPIFLASSNQVEKISDKQD